jgi:hypothetical protein
MVISTFETLPSPESSIFIRYSTLGKLAKLATTYPSSIPTACNTCFAMSIPRMLISCSLDVSPVATWFHRTPKALWLIAANPHRGRSLSLRPDRTVTLRFPSPAAASGVFPLQGASLLKIGRSVSYASGLAQMSNLISTSSATFTTPAIGSGFIPYIVC